MHQELIIIIFLCALIREHPSHKSALQQKDSSCWTVFEVLAKLVIERKWKHALMLVAQRKAKGNCENCWGKISREQHLLLSVMNPRCGCYLGKDNEIVFTPLRNSDPICSILGFNSNKAEVCARTSGLKARGSLECCRALYAAAATSFTSTFHWYWYTYSNPPKLLEKHAPVLKSSSASFFLFDIGTWNLFSLKLNSWCLETG